MLCSQCSSELRQIPAGVSKTTGKPYKAFMACPNRCKQGNYTPAPVQGAYQPQATGTQTYIDKDKMFFEALEKILEQQNLIAVQLERIENLAKSIESFVIGSETPEYEGAPVKKN